MQLQTTATISGTGWVVHVGVVGYAIAVGVSVGLVLVPC